MKFLHAADLHIDSPLRGLEALEEAPVDEIRAAPRKALVRLIELAHEEEVDFVILAGDIFDGDLHDVSTGLFFNAQLRALAPIPAFIVHGNHDAETEITRRIRPPSNVVTFKTARAHTELLDDIKVAIHGQSYRNRAVVDNLAAGYPEPVRGYTNIGVLHTSLGGYVGHENYAPCSLPALLNFGYNYWALGHIHQRQVLNENPWAVFPGNIQGRHIRETGPKGCYLIEGEGDDLNVTFQTLDSVRWFDERVDVSGSANADEAIDKAIARARSLQAEHGENLLCIRIELYGQTDAHRALMTDQVVHATKIRSEIMPQMWISELRVATSPVIDLAAVRQQDDLQGSLFRSIERLRQDPLADAGIAAEIKKLREKIPSRVVEKYNTKLGDRDVLRAAVDGAERILLAEMSG